MSTDNLQSYDKPEKELQDLLYSSYKESMYKLLIGRKENISNSPDDEINIPILLQKEVENKINCLVDNFKNLTLTANGLYLKKDGFQNIQIDLLGNICEHSNIVIFELKKSQKTERESFTELL
ncbi:MAG: hypothetical protein PHY80_05015, partial [Rickettsiales bacterium]|nr:hypothetical protein [Rickettsiales bacterium]